MTGHDVNRFTELLCSRLCHDLISPLGAVNNGVEIVGEGDPAVLNDAIGLIETRGLVAQIQALDAMLKAANVSLVSQVQIGGAYVTTIIRGDVGSVRAAVDAGASAASQSGELVSAHLIPRPEQSLIENFT